MLTADHGGPPGEKAPRRRGRRRGLPDPVRWCGARASGSADLYELNPDYADPGTGRPSYGGPQPVRNGDLANLATELLGLGPVPGSELDAGQDLDWR